MKKNRPTITLSGVKFAPSKSALVESLFERGGTASGWYSVTRGGKIRLFGPQGDCLGTPDQYYEAKRAEFAAAHAHDWVVYSATTGTSVDPVPAGMVKCYAGLGLRGNQFPDPTRVFLVSVAEYATRDHFGFIIDTARHQELPQAVAQ